MGTPSKVLICGSRTWTEVEPIRAYIESLSDDTIIIEGGARGADRIARVCAEEQGLEVREYPRKVDAVWQESGLSP